MARAIWTGTVGFGLVQIPVSLHAAEEAHELDLTLLDRRDFSPIGYDRINKKTGKAVTWEDIVKGYKRGPDQYVVLTDRDFEEANVEATRQIDILDFVDAAAIDSRFIERPYYLVPAKAGKKAYALLRETLKRANKAGIAKVVIRTRQHLSAVMVHGKAMVLVLLRFADELRGESDLELPDESLQKLGITAKELAMAEKLVGGMVEDWKPEKYQDDYRHDLLALIERKAKAGEINTVSEAPEAKSRPKTGGKVIDLAALLAQSLAQGPTKRPAKAPAPTGHRAGAKGKPRPPTHREGHRKSA